MTATLFEIAEARSFDKGQLASEAKYPDAVISEAEAGIREAFAQICGVSFVPVDVTAVLDGNGLVTLVLPDQQVTAVTAVSVSGTALTSDELAALVVDTAGLVTRPDGAVWACGARNISVSYTAGYASVPYEIKRAALILCVNQLRPTDLGDRTMSISSEAGTFRLATAGMGRDTWYGLPLVDSVLARYRVARVGVG